MANFVIIDCETTGLFSYEKPGDAEGQPRLAQMALVYLDENFQVIGSVTVLIKPEGWEMNDEAAKVHGHTQEKLIAQGTGVEFALSHYEAALDQGAIIVGYNVSYDLKVMRAELRRAGRPDRFETTLSIDCMRPLTDVCKLAKANGHRGYKTPKLTEAYFHLFGIEMTGAHDATDDAHACVRIFRWMIENKTFTPAQFSGVREAK